MSALIFACFATALLFVIVNLWEGHAKASVVGLKYNAGKRDRALPDEPGIRRASAAKMNLLENAAMFGFVALGLIASGASLGLLTIIGSWMWVLSRYGHFIAYITGQSRLRSLTWFTGIIGTLLLAADWF